jgi:hypothetical protein
VLVLVRQDHLVDEAVCQQRVLGIELDPVEDLEGPVADIRQVGADLVGAEDRKLAADLPRLLDCIVERPELPSKRLAAADSLNEPELLEVRDVPEIPDQRAEDRVVDAVQLLVAEWLDQLQSVSTRLLQTPGDLRLAIGSGPATTLCSGCCNLRDSRTLPRPLHRQT